MTERADHRILRQIREHERQVEALRQELASIQRTCSHPERERSGGGEAWLDTCMACGHVEVS